MFNVRQKWRIWRHTREWTRREEKFPHKWFNKLEEWNKKRKPYYYCTERKEWFGNRVYRTHSFDCDRKLGAKIGVIVPFYGAVPWKIGRWRIHLRYLNKLKDKIKDKFGWAIPHGHCDMWVCVHCGLKVYMMCGDMHYDWDKRKPIGCKITHRIPGRYSVHYRIT